MQYLATHGAPSTRPALAANHSAPAATNRLLAGDDNEEGRAELAVKVARQMLGLSERESSHTFALTIETLEFLARDAAVRVRDEAHPSVLLMPGTAAVTLRLPPDGQRAMPAPAGMLSL